MYYLKNLKYLERRNTLITIFIVLSLLSILAIVHFFSKWPIKVDGFGIGFLCGFALNFERTVIRICMRQCNKRNVWINAGNKGLEMDILCNVKSI